LYSLEDSGIFGAAVVEILAILSARHQV
jgi:hypothetical protein